ncbi:MAG: IS5 family transposase [Thermoguttaceae bacterium]|nr:IS5 family transposase [Thermoguttaceae bacterium]MDW8037001.1 IS5 family transposase [Thermoguttaceae bacterium]
MRGEHIEQQHGQKTFASLGFDQRRKATRRHAFLRSMNRVMPWEDLARLVEPYYPTQEGPGRPAKPLGWMLKLYFLQIWWNLSDPQTEDLMHDSHAVQEFLGLDLGRDRPPDETTICRFRHLLEKHQLGKRILEIVNRHLERAGLRVQDGTIVDATIIHAPTSRKNKQGQPSPEMGSTKKGHQWYYGMKVHVGVDAETKIVHWVEVTAANVHDSQVMGQLLHGEETAVYGDKAYVGQEESIRDVAPEAKSFVLHRAARNHPLRCWQEKLNRLWNSVRSGVEHVFGVGGKLGLVGGGCGQRGLKKNAEYAYGAVACVNVYRHRRRLLEYLEGDSPALCFG